MSGCNYWTDEQIIKLLNYFDTKPNSQRNKALLLFGIDSGFRISEILSLKRGDVLDEEGKVRKNINLIVTKNNHWRMAKLTDNCRNYLSVWLKKQERKKGIYSRKTPVFTANGEKRKVMSRWQVWKILKEACRYLCFDGRYATHSMRKTYGQKMHRIAKELQKNGIIGDNWNYMADALGHTGKSRIQSTQAYLSFEFINPNDYHDEAFEELYEKIKKSKQNNLRFEMGRKK